MLGCCACSPLSLLSVSDNASDEANEWGLVPISPEDYYGRSQLSRRELNAYLKMTNGVEALSESIDISGSKLTVEQFEKVLYYYRADYPQHFWLDAEYIIQTSNGTVLNYKPKYRHIPYFVKHAKIKLQEKTDAIMPLIAQCKTDLEKEKFIHDYLAENVKYYSGDHNNSHNTNSIYGIYGALIDGVAVCEGYSKAFQYLCYQAGIPCLFVTGDSVVPNSETNETVAHSWNIVKLDGKYYNVDSTWDDQSSFLFYTYFNVTDEQLQRDHSLSEDNYPLPKCDSNDAGYFSFNGGVFEDYTVESIASWLKQNDNFARIYIKGNPKEFIKWYEANIEEIARQAGVTGWYVYNYNQLGNEIIISIGSSNVK